jgi:hypothetical protein
MGAKRFFSFVVGVAVLGVMAVFLLSRMQEANSPVQAERGSAAEALVLERAADPGCPTESHTPVTPQTRVPSQREELRAISGSAIQGVLQCSTAAELAGIPIDVFRTGTGSPAVRVYSSDKGKFAVGLAQFLVGKDVEEGGGALEFILHVDQPPFLEEYVSTMMSPDDLTEGRDSAVTIRLRESPAVLRGRVVFPEEAPTAGSRVPVQVAAFLVDGDRVARVTPVDECECSDSESFELHLPAPGRYAVIAVSDHMRPTTLVVDSEAESSQSLVVSLVPGETVSGFVAVPSSEHEGARLVAEAVLPDDSQLLQWQGLRWVLAAAEYGYRTSVADQAGAFGFSGLNTTEYTISLRLLPNSITFAESTVSVVAPSAGVWVGSNVARVDIVVQSEERRIAGARVEVLHAAQTSVPGVTIRSRKALLTGNEGTVAAYVDCREEYEVTVSKNGYAQESRRIEGVASGAVVSELFLLQGQGESATLTLFLVGELYGVELLHVTLQRGGESKPAFDKVVALDGRRVDIHDLSPGQYDVSLSPTSGVHPPRGLNFCRDQASTVSVTSRGKEVHYIELELGGRLGVDARGLNSIRRYVLRDDQGREVKVHFQARRFHVADGLLRVRFDRNTGGIPVGAYSESFPNLRSGEYTLEFEELSREHASIPIRIHAGEVTSVVLE